MNVEINGEHIEFTQIHPKSGTTGLYFVDTEKRYFLKKLFLQNIKLLHNEVFFLKKLEKYDCFPKIVHIDKDFIVTTHVGESPTKENTPFDYESQCDKIYHILLHENIATNCKCHHLTVKDGKIYLVDFGGASIRPTILNRITHTTNFLNHPAYSNTFLFERMKNVFKK